MSHTEQWFLRQAWRRLAGLPEEPEPTPRPSLTVLRDSQWNDDFEELMRRRLIMGAFRYGMFSEQVHKRHNNPKSMLVHLAAYIASGNAEHLVDLANLALVEYTLPSHENFHFQSIDDGDHHAECVTESATNP